MSKPDSRTVAMLKSRRKRDRYPAATPERIAQLRRIREWWRGYSQESNVSKLLDALAGGPIIPHECRIYLGIPNPSEIARLLAKRLSQHGVSINARPVLWTDEMDDSRPTVAYELAHD